MTGPACSTAQAANDNLDTSANMKRTIICLLLLGIAGCKNSDLDIPRAIDFDDPGAVEKLLVEATDMDKLQWRQSDSEAHAANLKIPFKDAYTPDGKRPFTGWAKELHENGRVSGIFYFQGGKLHGPVVGWHENGQKLGETHYTNGTADGPGTNWYSNGQKASEFRYKDGRMISIAVWKPDGQPCQVTNVTDGNGVMVEYADDGTESRRMTYVNGVSKEDG